VVGSDMEEVGVYGLFGFEGLRPVGGVSGWRGGSSRDYGLVVEVRAPISVAPILK
jgi:hypothetical protein